MRFPELLDYLQKKKCKLDYPNRKVLKTIFDYWVRNDQVQFLPENYIDKYKLLNRTNNLLTKLVVLRNQLFHGLQEINLGIIERNLGNSTIELLFEELEKYLEINKMDYLDAVKIKIHNIVINPKNL